jgi:hypothetical protein
LPQSGLLATAVGIIVSDKKLLICETPQGQRELPGFIVAKPQEAIKYLNQFLSRWSLSELPQQTLYLSEVTLNHDLRKKVTGVVRILRFSHKLNLKLPNGQYWLIEQLLQDEQSTALTKAVAGWLSLTD